MNVAKILSLKASPDIDATAQRLAAIHATAVLFSVAYADGALTEANPQIVAAAWDGIALLADDATQFLHGSR